MCVYEIDDKDEVELLTNIPWPEAGASMPIVFSSENRIIVSYFPSSRNVKLNQLIQSFENPFIIIKFLKYDSYMFGAPNDEALGGHPLAKRGLEPYGVHIVHNSSWIRKLERNNSIHPKHQPGSYHDLHHYIITFQDSTLECTSQDIEYAVVEGRNVTKLMTDYIYEHV